MNFINIPKNAKKSSMPIWIDPMLATLTYQYFSHPDWIYECKFDGERCLAYCDQKGEIRIYSRNKILLNNTYPELVIALSNSKSKPFIIDGEIVAFKNSNISSFSKLQNRLQLKKPSEHDIQKTPVYYYVFDMLYFTEYDLQLVPLIDRKLILKKNISFNKLIIYTEHKAKKGLDYYDFACKSGWEGIIAKNALSAYQNRRSKDWLKFKCGNQQEFIIIGYTKPEGSRVGLGALLLGYYDSDFNLCYAGKVGTGFNRDTLRLLKNKLSQLELENPPIYKNIKGRNACWVQPRLVCEVGFTEWTNDGKLRHPRYLGLRTDKDSKEVIRETEQLKVSP